MYTRLTALFFQNKTGKNGGGRRIARINMVFTLPALEGFGRWRCFEMYVSKVKHTPQMNFKKSHYHNVTPKNINKHKVPQKQVRRYKIVVRFYDITSMRITPKPQSCLLLITITITVPCTF
jgi:hypothetical protein